MERVFRSEIAAEWPYLLTGDKVRDVLELKRLKREEYEKELARRQSFYTGVSVSESLRNLGLSLPKDVIKNVEPSLRVFFEKPSCAAFIQVIEAALKVTPLYEQEQGHLYEQEGYQAQFCTKLFLRAFFSEILNSDIDVNHIGLRKEVLERYVELGKYDGYKFPDSGDERGSFNHACVIYKCMQMPPIERRISAIKALPRLFFEQEQPKFPEFCAVMELLPDKVYFKAPQFREFFLRLSDSINDFSERAKCDFVNRLPDLIQFIENPSEKVQLAAVLLDPSSEGMSRIGVKEMAKLREGVTSYESGGCDGSIIDWSLFMPARYNHSRRRSITGDLRIEYLGRHPLNYEYPRGLNWLERGNHELLPQDAAFVSGFYAVLKHVKDIAPSVMEIIPQAILEQFRGPNQQTSQGSSQAVYPPRGFSLARYCGGGDSDDCDGGGDSCTGW